VTDRLIYVALVAVWMAYLVPMGLRRYREVSVRGSIESFSSSMLALGGRGGWERAATRAAPGGTPAGAPVAARAVDGPPTGPLDRPSARRAAARRRRTLLVLLALTALTGVLVVATSLAWPAVLVPSALIVTFVVASHLQVSREEDAAWVRAAARQAGPSASPRAAVRAEVTPVGDEPDDADTVVLSDGVAAQIVALLAEPVAFDDAPPAKVESGGFAVAAAAAAADSAGSTWDLRPMTLPTYVTKPRAARSVSRVDPSGPDTWTSNRIDAEQTELEGAAEPPAARRRAVGG